jgi:hypothetical protein
MVSPWDVYREVADDIRDEEMLNDCFADLVEDTLEHDASFLNRLLDGLVVFHDHSRLKGTDRAPLPYRDEGTDRKIDITIGDESKLVGFESKRRDGLSRRQLEGELDKLRYNADGREAYLVAVTEDLSRPSILEELPDNVLWTSWFRIAQRVHRDGWPDSWQPTVSRASKMFRAFGYTPFEGIDMEEFRPSVWELWKQIATQVEGVETGERRPYRILKEAKGTSRGFVPIDPDWMLLSFSVGSTGDPDETCYALLSNKKTQTIRLGLAIEPWGGSDEDFRAYMCERADELATLVLEHEMEVVQFPLHRFVGRKTLPDGHQKAVTAEFPERRDELEVAFSDKKGMRNDGANRFVLGYTIDLSEPLAESVATLEQLREVFGTDDGSRLAAAIGGDVTGVTT